MPIEVHRDGVTITGAHIEYARLIALRGALKLEMKGLRRSGRSANTIACDTLGLPRGTRRNITLEKLEERIASWRAS